MCVPAGSLGTGRTEIIIFYAFWENPDLGPEGKLPPAGTLRPGREVLWDEGTQASELRLGCGTGIRRCGGYRRGLELLAVTLAFPSALWGH